MCYLNGMRVTNEVRDGLVSVFELPCMKQIKKWDILMKMMGFKTSVTMILDVVKESSMEWSIKNMLTVH